MKIGIDIRPLSLFNENRVGLYQYTYNLVSHLLAIDSYNDYVLLSSLRGFRGDGRISGKFVRKFSGRLSDLLVERLSFPIEWLIGRVEVFHGPSYYIPRCRRCAAVVTIHDLIAFRRPDLLTHKMVLTGQKTIEASARRYDMVITVSNYAKEDIVDFFKIPEHRVKVIYNGVCPAFHPIKDKAGIEKITAKYGITAPYLLFVGKVEPKKNLKTLVQASVRLRNTTEHKYPLLIVGEKAWDFQSVWSVVRQLHAEDTTIFAGVVPDEDLPYLYNGAELFLFPSLFEGFGLPVIEAMACGTPVVTSNQTSIPEIAADAALLVDPLNVEALASAMADALSNPSLRAQLIVKGLERAREFSWEKTARETLALYQELA
jgi:glycosyltransferase involved in cell wall biosynthesis